MQLVGQPQPTELQAQFGAASPYPPTWLGAPG